MFGGLVRLKAVMAWELMCSLHTGLDWCVCARCETVRAYTNYVCVFFMLVSAWVAIMHASLVVSA